MTKARMDGLYLVLLGAVTFLLVGSALENAALVSSVDFRVMYYSARCALEHCDPYNATQLQQVYRTEGGETPFDTPITKLNETQFIYPPTAFSITAPFALLPFWPAHVLWLAVTAVSMILASFLVWDIGAQHRPVFTGALVCLTLANSELFLILGNPAGIAISFCVIAVWCFLRERFVAAGVLCLAISLALKPHDAGLVWLYFVLAGGANRMRALQATAVAVALSIPPILWVAHVAPHWMTELSLNLAANAAPGGLSDPGPQSMAAHGIGMLVSLQAVFSMFRDSPGFYNLMSYLVCGVLLLVWLLKTLRARLSPAMAWFALAPVSALTMLPVYHRIYDARLLLLAIPACAVLWAEGGALAWTAFILTAAEIVMTGGILWAILLPVIGNSHLPAQLVVAAQIVPVPLILLAISIFYLWVYWRRVRVDELSGAVLDDQID